MHFYDSIVAFERGITTTKTAPMVGMVPAFPADSSDAAAPAAEGDAPAAEATDPAE
jgi:hypothetical protein